MLTTDQDVPVNGLFFGIGHEPASGFLQGQLETDQQGYIVTKPGEAVTSVEGSFALCPSLRFNHVPRCLCLRRRAGQAMATGHHGGRVWLCCRSAGGAFPLGACIVLVAAFAATVGVLSDIPAVYLKCSTCAYFFAKLMWLSLTVALLLLVSRGTQGTLVSLLYPQPHWCLLAVLHTREISLRSLDQRPTMLPSRHPGLYHLYPVY
jgi:hypothetical protein